MSPATISSTLTFIGIIFLALIVFGWTWKVLGIGICVSTILSIIYYITIKKVFEDSKDYDGKSKVQ